MRLFEFSQTERLIAKLDKIENLDDADFNIKIPSPITVDDTGDLWDEADGMKCPGDTNEFVNQKRAEVKSAPTKVEIVPHDKMFTGQRYVSGEGLRNYLENPDREKLPYLHYHNGKYVIFDGNHRIVSDILTGKTSSKCEVKYVDKYIDPDGCFI